MWFTSAEKNVLMGELEKRKNLKTIKLEVEKKKYFKYILLFHEDTDRNVQFPQVLSHQQSMQAFAVNGADRT